jgi:hypothetical protein
VCSRRKWRITNPEKVDTAFGRIRFASIHFMFKQIVKSSYGDAYSETQTSFSDCDLDYINLVRTQDLMVHLVLAATKL